MMRNILFIVALFFSMHLNAQTGIGTTTPHASAKLEISSNNKGFLPPRVIKPLLFELISNFAEAL